MELWSGSAREFIREVDADALAGKMAGNFINYHKYSLSQPERDSWRVSLGELSDVLRKVTTRDIGVVLEYHFPYSGKRIDAILLGKDSTGQNSAIIVELKQWSEAHLEATSDNIKAGNTITMHPSARAGGANG
jgi:hypothetical protein